MSNLTLTILDSDNGALSVTEHGTLTEALNEYKGWEKQGAVDYIVQGTMTVKCACMRVLESRNRAISLKIAIQFNGDDATEARIEVKAPQAVKYLEALLGGAENAEIAVVFTPRSLYLA